MSRILQHATWTCHDCDAGGEYNNAEGVASKHAKKTGHRVTGEIFQTFSFGGSE